jgi:hypothetical protein
MSGEILALSEHALIGPAHCAEIAARVRQLSSYWTPRSRTGFYSLGAASYLDAVKGPAPYLSAAQATNSLLLDEFGELYDRVVAFFGELLHDEVSLDLERAVPGFHVFALAGEDRRGDNPARRAHFDLQWRLAYPGARPEAMLSFTLAIATPTGGAGMALWPLRSHQPDLIARVALSQTLEQAPQIVSYTIGRLVVHDGLQLHAIDASRTVRSQGLRITLQGHGVRLRGRWRLYW